ncbi:MAG: isocitrate lyase/phosphoenolpyruvate mutase family protein [Nitrososphaerota archaeon]|nr:isocitrate lyase/phosphoenolpyruvate mutase family protein [Nitrososphaerota archaeon]
MDQAEKAEAFRGLHDRKDVLVLPNACDVPSSWVFENEGFPVVATSSAGMLVSLGHPDAEGIPRGDFVAAIRRISGVLTVPLSADLVGGFGDNPEEVAKSARAVVEAGAVGINIEDYIHGAKGLPPVPELRKLGVARVSFGPTASYAAMGLVKQASREVLEKGTYDTLTEGAIDFDELNSLAVPRNPVRP